jgi:hypothetical protein
MLSQKVSLPLGHVELAARTQRGTIAWLARAGFVARALLYGVIGGLAALAAFGYGGEATDSKGALHQMYGGPFGQGLLVATTVGLFGYGAFMLCQALWDPERTAQRGWRLAKRPWWAVVALIHGSLGVYAAQLVAGSGGDAHDETKSRTAALLGWAPVGPWLVGAIGVGLMLGAAYGLVRAWRAKLDEQLDLSRLAGATRRWVVRLCRIGIAARACVGLVAGGFLLAAAINSDPNEAKGFGASLATLRGMPFGGWLFAAVALGLLAFGFHELVQARYRRVLGQSV